MLASMITATAMPTPTSLMKITEEVAKAPIATQNKIAACVTIRPVRSRPMATESVFEWPASWASPIRVSTSTA